MTAMNGTAAISVVNVNAGGGAGTVSSHELPDEGGGEPTGVADDVACHHDAMLKHRACRCARRRRPHTGTSRRLMYVRSRPVGVNPLLS